MSSSLRLLLEDFLGLMREEGELDLFLPLLLSAMGHEIVYRAQKGTRQYGVDVSTVGKDSDGRKKLFLWLVKCGDIGRTAWNSGEQAIRPSMDEVGDVYLTSHVEPQYAGLPKKLVVVTNGDFNASLAQTMAAKFTDWSRRHRAEVVKVNGSTLAQWTEHFLLDENVLPESDRMLLRRMLANVTLPEMSIAAGRQLFADLLKRGKQPAATKAARKKRLLNSIRGVRTALSVLHVWAQKEDNLVASYRLAEFALLAVWADLHELMDEQALGLARELGELLAHLLIVGEAYHAKMQPFYVTQDAFAHALPDELLVTDTAFSELGRLSLQGLIWAFQAAAGELRFAEGVAAVYVNRVRALLQSHTCTRSPAFDHHAIDIHAAMLLLVVFDRRDDAKAWLAELAGRLAVVAGGKHWPMAATFEDLLWIRHNLAELSQEFRSTSTLLPVLMLWTCVLEQPDGYAFLRDKLLPAVPGTTLNVWTSDAGYDAAVSDPQALHEHGVGEAIVAVPETPEKFVQLLSSPVAAVQPISESAWYRHRAAYVPLLAALHWRLQIPKAMLVEQSLVYAQRNLLLGASSPTT